MKNTLGLYSLAAALLLLAGCATTVTPPPGGTQPGTTTQPGVLQPAQPPEAVAPPPVIAPVQRAEMSQIPAVVALLDRAQNETNTGHNDAAGASLERALRIQPRNPWVWQQLAQVRLEQGRYDLAISLARKSNSFSGANHMLQAVNWQLISKARVAKGDSAGADEAMKKATGFAEKAQAEAAKAAPGQTLPGQPVPGQPIPVPTAP